MIKSTTKRRFKITIDFDQKSSLHRQETIVENLYISDMYDYYLRFSDSSQIKKIVIVITDNNTEIEFLSDEVVVIPIYFDIIAYSSISPREQKYYFLNLICKNIVVFASSKNWDEEPFLEAMRVVVDKNFVFRDFWKNPITNQNHTAQIFWEYDTNIRIFLEVIGEKPTIYLLSILPPAMGALEDILGQLQWQDEKTVKLWHTNKRDYWIVNIESNEVDFFYPRATSGDPHGLYDLAVMYLEGQLVLKDQEKGVKLLRQSADKKFGRAIKKLSRIGIEFHL